MDWTALLSLPTTLLLIAAALALLLALAQLLKARGLLELGQQASGAPRGALLLAAGWRGLLFVIAFVLAAVLAIGAWTVRGYRLLAEETPVVEIDAHILSPQRWTLTLHWPDGDTRQLPVNGDDWRVEAVVLKWKLPAALAGMPPIYRLDRVSGRYDDPAQELNAPRTVVDFNQAGPWDLLNLRKRWPQWVPGVDALYGSGVYLPLVDGGHYTVGLTRLGQLLARPDETTERRIAQPL